MEHDAVRHCPLLTERVGRQLRHLLAQVINVHVGVALSGVDAGMAEQFLHCSQVGPRTQGIELPDNQVREGMLMG